LINLTAKKIYCPKCQKLVRVKRQKVGEKDQYTCIKCDYMIWDKESRKWKYYRVE
jgi:ssDNA-binding Zn-finger/Zn-ribbon topoisomerase 1